MTTKVTVDAHAGWPVEVQFEDVFEGEGATETTVVVEANTVRDFYVHTTRNIVSIKELKREDS